MHVIADFARGAILALATAPALGATPTPPAYVLKPGQEIVFSVEIRDGAVVAGPPRLAKLGTATPGPGEMVVGLTPRDKDLYSQILLREATPLPVDFVATGEIGEIKIDERELCGRLSAPTSQRIGGTSWTVVLSQFAVGRGDGTCP